MINNLTTILILLAVLARQKGKKLLFWPLLVVALLADAVDLYLRNSSLIMYIIYLYVFIMSVFIAHISVEFILEKLKKK